MSANDPPQIVCVTLNPAVDRTYEVDGLEIGQHAKGRLVFAHPAGKAVNVARVLQHLGSPCILTGFVGEAQRPLFEESFDPKIVHAQLFGVPYPTRENVTLVDVSRGTETHVRDIGHPVTDDDITKLTRKLEILSRPGVWMVFAGSLPQGLAVECYWSLLQAVVGKGARVVLDSSEAALAVVRRVPVWLIKPNRRELAELTGMPAETAGQIVAAVRSLGKAAQVALVSAGADGCYFVDRRRALHARLTRLPRQAVNTVGCGDALLAGFLAARAQGRRVEECLRHAVAAGTGACFHLRAGEVDPAEVARIVPQVEVQPLDL
jgi:1-phosphofructokinase family hexose kinase